MPDVYANIHKADPATLERLSDVIEDRAPNPKQRTMLENYLFEIPCRRYKSLGANIPAQGKITQYMISLLDRW